MHNEASHTDITSSSPGQQLRLTSGPENTSSSWPPKSLSDWRFVQTDPGPWPIGHARSLWDPLESFFAERGYRLFIYYDQEYDVPADGDEVRSPDPYHHFIGERKSSRFYCTRNKHCAATRISDGTHVVIQLLAIGEDGQTEVAIQNRLHNSPLPSTFPNRAVPLLDMVTYEQERMVFGVFPLLCAGVACPRYSTPQDGFKICGQWMEAVAYLHENLVAHLDIGLHEFLLNYAGPLDDPFIIQTQEHFRPFFQLFDFQWWITDFGESVIFDPSSSPAERKVTGLCAGKLNIEMIDYPKMLGPEVYRKEKRDVPYCPFKHDVYQLGKTLLEYLHGLAYAYPGFDDILRKMSAEEPDARPTMREAVAELEAYTSSLIEEDFAPKRTFAPTMGPWLPEHIKILRREAEREQSAATSHLDGQK